MIDRFFKQRLRNTPWVVCCVCVALASFPIDTVANERPNVLVIVADDLGYHDVGFNGLDDFSTPNIDRLAGDGVICRNGYASHPYCAPTRAGLMTGRYQHRFGFEGNPAKGDVVNGLPASETTLADRLATAGYETVGIGKWHLGEGKHHHPVRRGFDSYFGFLEGSRSYFKTDCQWLSLGDNDTIESRAPLPTSRNDYLTDLLTDEAVAFIQRPRDKPYFMYLAYNAPHTPMQATQSWLDRVPDISDKKRRTYAAMVTALDDGIGRVRAAIAEQGETDQTLVFFFSDNGGITPVNAASNEPFSGMKGTLLEGGIHVPYVVSWPGKVPAGTEYKPGVMTFDVFATACGAAGVSDIDDSLDSVDLVPFLAGESSGHPHDVLYWRTGQGFQLSARKGPHKFLHVHGTDDRVFDLSRDVTESRPGVAVKPADADALGQSAREWSGGLPESTFTGHGLKHEAQWRALGLTSPPDTDMSP